MEKPLRVSGFTRVTGSNQALDPKFKIGAIGRFRVIINPILTYRHRAGALVGAAVGGFTPESDLGINIDVYPLIIMGRGNSGGDAFGQVPLRGFDSVDANHYPPSEKFKIDPLGQRGYVSAMTWRAGLFERRLDGGLMGRNLEIRTRP